MQTQRWQEKQISYGNLVRVILISITVLFLLIAGFVWILNLGGTSWSTPLAATFVVLSVLFGFFQWRFPRPPINSQKSTLLIEEQAYDIFKQKEKGKLKRGNDKPR